MEITPKGVYAEYLKGVDFKVSLGKRGMYEQNKINERFFDGDQWHGISVGSDRPLVCHNLIKRIGNYKNAKLSGEKVKIKYSVKGEEALKDKAPTLVSTLDANFLLTQKRLKLNELTEEILRASYITGTGILYTYWNESENTGFFADEKHLSPILGDISCERLPVENVYFGDVTEQNTEKQPYIIIACEKRNTDIKNTVKTFFGDRRLLGLPDDGKTLTLTKLFKKDGVVFGITVTEKYVIRNVWNLKLTRYPIAVFKRDGGNTVYGESEVSNLIQNQVAINRMLTASVWATMSMGMPIMAVNGDTIGENITNDPGQIIRIYGENEDVANSIRFIAPPDFSDNFKQTIEMLTNCTLASASVSSAALGEYNYSNAAAITALQSSVDESLNSLKNRFLTFFADLALIFADFWINKYGVRKITDGNKEYNFDTKDYNGIMLTADAYTEEKNEIL